MNRAATSTLALLALAAPAGAREENPIDAVRAQVEAFAEAYRVADVAAIDALLSADYVQINGGAAPIGREAYLDWNRTRAAHLASGAWRVEAYDLSEVTVTLHWPGGMAMAPAAAVVTGRVTAAGERDGAPWASDVRMTNLWVLEDGDWKRAAFHDAPVEP